MKLFNKFSIVYVGFASLLMITGCVHNKQKEKEMDKTNANAESVFSLSYMDKTVKPEDDFYKFCNATWQKNNPIPAQYSRFSAFEKLFEQNLVQLKTIFEEVATNKKDTNIIHKKIGDFYACGMDSVKIEADGIAPLKEELNRILAIKTIKDLQDGIVHFNSIGIFPIFDIAPGQDDKNSNMVIMQLQQGGLGLPDRDYYTAADARSKELREEYVKHMGNIFSLAGDNKEDATKKATIVMQIETRLAKASMTLNEQRDPNKVYNKFNLNGIKKLVPEIDWQTNFATLGISVGDINVRQPNFFKEVGKMMKSVSINEWKIYLTWNLLNNTTPYLSSKFDQENFRFFGTVLSGKTKQQERWKRVLNNTSALLGEAVGQLYVEKYFPPTAKKHMLELVQNLKAALKEHITKLSWMSDVTKNEASAKLAAIGIKIGYPDKWKDYSTMEVKHDSYVLNIFRANQFHIKTEFAKINKPVDRSLWGMTPQTINAYYDPSMNEIVFPAGILQPPFFDMNADDAVNYGAIGAVIGHEMTHGFDDQGKQYDKQGNLKNWWQEADTKNFNTQVHVLVDQYNAYKLLDSLHVDGNLTLGENIADIGGVTVSLTALKNSMKNKKTVLIDGYTPIQRFFIAYGQVWRLNINDKELMRRIREDVHSTGEARVNGIVYNIPDFYEAFNIKNGKRYKAENERARVW